MLVDADAPFALKHPAEIERRRGMLSLSHIAPLVAYAARVKAGRGAACELPLFDPCDGGTAAKLLFLLEAPGPKAVSSSFISRNNPDLTARNMNLLLQEAELPRRECLLWNIVPWYIGDGKRIRGATKADVADAMPYLKDLLGALPLLRAIVLVGKPAGSAAPAIRELSLLPLYLSYHPSPKVFNVYPEKRAEALTVFRSLRKYVAPQA